MALYRTLFLSSPVTSTESTMTTSRTTTAGFGLQRRGIVVARIGHVRCVSVGGKLRGDETFMSHAVAPACILNPKSLNLRQSMAYVEEVSE